MSPVSIKSGTIAMKGDHYDMFGTPVETLEPLSRL